MKKLKDIVLIGFLALLAFTACTEETLIDEWPVETGMVSISFSAEGVETKAINAGGTYQYATADELNINKIFVSIFKKVDNEWRYLTSKTGTLGDGSFVGTQSSGSFKLTGLTLPLNTELKVVAIVNPLKDKIDSYVTMDYATLREESVSYPSSLGGKDFYTFDPKTLIKVGEENMTFTLTKGSVTGGKTVSLKQLAAKVELDLKVDLSQTEGSVNTGEWAFNWVSFKIVNVNTTSKLVIPVNSLNDQLQLRSSNEMSINRSVTEVKIPFYTYERAKVTEIDLINVLSVEIAGTFTASKESIDYKYSIPINPEYKDGESTDGLIHGNYYRVTGTLKRSTGKFKIWVAPWKSKGVEANFN
jgi:hypothetical protein